MNYYPIYYLNNDLSVGQPGKIPDAETYNRGYGENRWYTTFTLSNSIGQGEVLATPIQLANMAAAIGNRGYYFTPHIIKNIEERVSKDKFFGSGELNLLPYPPASVHPIFLYKHQQ